MFLSLALPGAARASDADFMACRNNDPTIAIAGCTSAIESGTESGEVLSDLHSMRGLAYFHAGDYAKAIPDLTEALRVKNDKAIAAAQLSIRGAAYYFTGDTTRAIADYTASIALVPDGGPYNPRGLAYLKMKNYRAAIADYDMALKSAPDSAQALYGRGLANLAVGDTAAADRDMSRAITIQANVADAFIREGFEAKP
jgi:tetratricopeptide (TPR) repeat protein